MVVLRKKIAHVLNEWPLRTFGIPFVPYILWENGKMCYGKNVGLYEFFSVP